MYKGSNATLPFQVSTLWNRVPHQQSHFSFVVQYILVRSTEQFINLGIEYSRVTAVISAFCRVENVRKKPLFYFYFLFLPSRRGCGEYM